MTGEEMKKARKAKGLTQKQLAEKVGVCKRTIELYENIGRKPRNILTEIEICKILDLPFSHLIWEIVGSLPDYVLIAELDTRGYDVRK